MHAQARSGRAKRATLLVCIYIYMLRTLKDSGRSISHVGMLYKQEHMFLLCGFNCGAIDSLCALSCVRG